MGRTEPKSSEHRLVLVAGRQATTTSPDPLLSFWEEFEGNAV